MIDVTYYQNNGSIAVQFKGRLLSVNIDDISGNLKPGLFCVKNWSENAELAAEAFQTGLFEDTGVKIPTGFVEAPIWKLLDEDLIKKHQNLVGILRFNK